MFKTQPTLTEIYDYSEEQEKLDRKTFEKYLEGLSNIQHSLLFNIILDNYSEKDQEDILDIFLDIRVKDVLCDLWDFRSANGLGE